MMQWLSKIERVEKDKSACLNDALAVEDPLEIRIGFRKGKKTIWSSLAITMRTPGDDLDLAAGFLLSEGIINKKDDIQSIEKCGQGSRYGPNTIKVRFKNSPNIDEARLSRTFPVNSSCGVCGKSSLAVLESIKPAQLAGKQTFPKVSPQILFELPEKLRHSQRTFDQTGGLHASGLFSPCGNLLALKEDVGRHNALDKLIGSFLLAKKLPLSNHILLLSGRVSFELIQKSAMAGIQFVAAIGAPSSLAVELAAKQEITLIGFLKRSRFNVYCGKSRIEEAENANGFSV